MSATVRWTTTCTGCGKVEEKELKLTEDNWQDYDWGPGCPEDWLQVSHDEKTDTHFLFFHSDDCYKTWLRGQGRLEEIKAFDETIWLA